MVYKLESMPIVVLSIMAVFLGFYRHQVRLPIVTNMPMQLFYAPNEEQEFQSWMDAHPTGYVLNAKKGASQGHGLYKLHKSQCSHLMRRPNRTKDYYKTCSESEAVLRNFANTELKPDDTLDCGDCFPKN